MLFKKKKTNVNIDMSNLPRHIAFIMDGNGRWARVRGLPRNAGHNEGGKTLLNIVKACNDLGIKAVTVYAFSTENWKRPKDEVEFIMSLPNKYITTYLPKIKSQNIRMNFIGYIEKLPEEIRANMEKAVAETKDNTGIIFTIAMNYGSQSEIISAVKTVALEYGEQKVTLDEITPEYFERKLMTHGLPPVDMLVRTSGELRLSNYLLWQIAYSELYFTKAYWPDFDENELKNAISEYQKRNRRYGGLEE